MKFSYPKVCDLLRRTADSLDGPDRLGAAREADRIFTELTPDERTIGAAVAQGIVKRIREGR